MPSKRSTYKRRRQSRRIVGEGRSFGSAAGAARVRDEKLQEIREARQAEASALLGEILDMFESGDLPSLIAQTVIARAENGGPSAYWTLRNQLLMIRQGTTDARGIHQWNEVGRKVVKGSRAIRIFGPRLVKRENEAGDESMQLIGWRTIPVFRVQDTEGDKLESLSYEPAQLPPLYDVAARLGVRVDYMPAHELANYRGFYLPGSREIALCTADERTWFHELAHAAHDVSLRAKGKSIADVSEAEREIVAETVAAVLCKLYDRDGYLYHSRDYIARYAGDTPPAKAAAHVLGPIQDALYLIVDHATAADAERAA